MRITQRVNRKAGSTISRELKALFKNQGGQSIVELALFTPILALCLIAAVSILDIAEKKVVVTRLASFGGREIASKEADDLQSVEERIKQAFRRAEPTEDDRLLTVHFTEAKSIGMANDGSTGGEPLMVSVSYLVRIPLLARFLSEGGIEVSGDAVMERPSK